MKIIDRKTSEIIPYEKNPRINNNAVDKTAISIKEFGFQQPIVVDPAGVVIAGHTRLKAAIKLKLETCPVIVAEGLTDAQIKAYRIADNRTGELATWDNELLAVEIQDLIDMKYDIELTGFDASDFDSGDKGGLTPDDQVPDVPEDPVIKLGDIWLLGNHRVMCGDSTDRAQVELLMDGKKADMVFTDPPYGMSLDTDYSKMPSTKIEGNKRYKKIKGDNDDFNPELIRTVFLNFDYCKEIFLFGADYYAEYLVDKNKGSWCVWDKRVTEKFDKMIGSGFELCWSKAKHKRMLARVNNTLFSGESDAINKVHPTQKPIKLIEWFFDYWSVKGKDNIVDLYLGSGSTLIACEKTNRTCYGMELDPHYCDVILKRWADYTGKDPVREDGTKYKDLR